MPDTTHADWEGRTLKDRNGDKIGKIDSLYVDEQTDKPEWALVNTGMFGTKSSFVPLAGATAQGDDLLAQVDADQVRDAPKMDSSSERVIALSVVGPDVSWPTAPRPPVVCPLPVAVTEPSVV